jgi:recombination protein RecA
MPPAAHLRAKIEAALAERIPSALSPTLRIVRDVMPTGIRPVDELLHGGFPVGAITELVGAECSGRTSLALSFVAEVTRIGNVCAWVDVSDALHPESAAAAGMDLRRLLWVRCGVSVTGPDAAMRNTFTLPEKYFIPKPAKQGLHGGGFGPHPRGEVKGLSDALVGLLQPEAIGPRCAEPQPKVKSAKPTVGDLRSTYLPKKANVASTPWSRLDQALRATDLLLHNGGFGVVVLDMGGIAPENVVRIPLATWFRYRAVAEQKQTSILLLLQHACAKSSAGLTLCLHSGTAVGNETTVFAGIEHFLEVSRQRFSADANDVALLRKPPQAQRCAHWQSRTVWTSR